jgi:N-methylhydantoinase A
VIERKGATVGLLVTEGFRDILELQRQDRESIYELHYQKPVPLVPRDLAVDVRERVGATGEIVTPLDEDSTRRAVETLEERGVNAIAVCLLHAYKNPDHERRVREIVGEVAPGLHVSLSSEIVAEFREYERASTTVIDAFVKPVVDRYVEHLGREATSLEIDSLSIMQSNGGTLPASYARQIPVRTLFSGPAAGVTGAVTIANAAGLRNIIQWIWGAPAPMSASSPAGSQKSHPTPLSTDCRSKSR